MTEWVGEPGYYERVQRWKDEVTTVHFGLYMVIIMMMNKMTINHDDHDEHANDDHDEDYLVSWSAHGETVTDLNPPPDAKA